VGDPGGGRVGAKRCIKKMHIIDEMKRNSQVSEVGCHNPPRTNLCHRRRVGRRSNLGKTTCLGHRFSCSDRTAARRVNLVGVVQLDNLDRFKVCSCLLGEPHQKHSAQREIGSNLAWFDARGGGGGVVCSAHNNLRAAL
jgi:hypothetical protein